MVPYFGFGNLKTAIITLGGLGGELVYDLVTHYLLVSLTLLFEAFFDVSLLAKTVKQEFFLALVDKTFVVCFSHCQLVLPSWFQNHIEFLFDDLQTFRLVNTDNVDDLSFVLVVNVDKFLL